MEAQDEITIANQRLWEEEVKKGCGYTIPYVIIACAFGQRQTVISGLVRHDA